DRGSARRSMKKSGSAAAPRSCHQIRQTVFLRLLRRPFPPPFHILKPIMLPDSYRRNPLRNSHTDARRKNMATPAAHKAADQLKSRMKVTGIELISPAGRTVNSRIRGTPLKMSMG